MAPFPPMTSREIRRRDGWACTSCGKSTYDAEKYLLEAAHIDHTRNENYINPDNGKTQCRICHLLDTMDSGDVTGVNKIANRIWNSGISHYSVYEENPSLMREHRIQLSELLAASGWSGRVHIKEEVTDVRTLRAYVAKGLRKLK